jgi:hypothetical protein
VGYAAGRNAGWSRRPASARISLSLRPRDPTRIVFLFTMSNSAVFFVPTARCCPRVLYFRFVRIIRPKGGAAERRRRVTGMSVALARRDDSPPERREGASRRSRWRFSAAGPTLLFRQCPPESAPRRSSRPDITPGRSGPRLPRLRFAPGLGTPLPRSALGASPETPLASEDGVTLLHPPFVVNYISHQINVAII